MKSANHNNQTMRCWWQS